MKLYKEGGGIHRDIQKGGNDGNIQAMISSHYFVVCKVALFGV